MIKKLLILICVIPTFAFAKKMPPFQINDIPEAQPKFRHYVGVQSNLLIRQVLNLSGNTATTNNPYLFTYAINNRKGWGLSAGLGLITSNTSTSDLTGSFDKRTTQNFNLRLGVEKRFVLHQKWNALVGVDGLINKNKSTSDVKTVQIFGVTNTSTNTTKNENNGIGGAIRAALSYSITPRIQLGTETSLAFTSGKEKFSGSTFSDDGFGNINSTSTSNTSKVSGFNMNVPTAFFVILKF